MVIVECWEAYGQYWRGKRGIKISLYAGRRHSGVSQKRWDKEKEIAEACRKELGHTENSSTTMKYYAKDRQEEI